MKTSRRRTEMVKMIDPKTVEKLEGKIEEAIGGVIVRWASTSCRYCQPPQDAPDAKAA